MQITRNIAERAARMIVFCDGSPEQAAHECRVQLRALAFYRDKELERTLETLNYVCRFDGEKREKLLAQLAGNNHHA